MKIALVSDIHSNNIAFEAVLRDINNEKADMIFFLGDYVFGGYGSNETIDLLIKCNRENKDNLIILGNIDELITPIEKNADWIYPVNKEIYNELGEERIKFLKSLPDALLVEKDGVVMSLCHNPSDGDVFINADSLRRENNAPNRDELARIAEAMESDICIFGHYHLFMDEEVNGKRFICPGSVGMPFNGDPRAQYTILNITNNKISTSRRCVEYDRLKFVNEFDKKGYIEKYRKWSMDIITTVLTAHNYFGT